jgi:hypothetical protein
MEQYHWTYEEYMNTPEYVIRFIVEKSIIDEKKRKSEERIKKWK